MRIILENPTDCESIPSKPLGEVRKARIAAEKSGTPWRLSMSCRTWNPLFASEKNGKPGKFARTAQRAGMTRIDAMELGGTSGDKIIAVQGQPGTAHSKVIAVPTVEALNTPLAQSSQAFTAAQQAQHPANPQSQQPLQTAQPDPAKAQPAMSR